VRVDMAVSVLSTQIVGQSLPEESGRTSMAVGNVDWTVSNARIVQFMRPTSTVVVSPATGITWATNNAKIKVNGNWRYSYR